MAKTKYAMMLECGAYSAPWDVAELVERGNQAYRNDPETGKNRPCRVEVVRKSYNISKRYGGQIATPFCDAARVCVDDEPVTKWRVEVGAVDKSLPAGKQRVVNETREMDSLADAADWAESRGLRGDGAPDWL